MPSTFDSLLRLELQADGENDTTWGQKTNTNLELIAEAIAGRAIVTVAGSGDLTLSTANASTDQSRPMILEFVGAAGTGRNVIIPGTPKVYFAKASSDVVNAITIKTAGGTGYRIAGDENTILYCDGVSVWSGTNTIRSDTDTALTVVGNNSNLAAGNFDGTLMLSGNATSATPSMLLLKPGAAGIKLGINASNNFTIGGASWTSNRLQLASNGALTIAGPLTVHTDVVGGLGISAGDTATRRFQFFNTYYLNGSATSGDIGIYQADVVSAYWRGSDRAFFNTASAFKPGGGSWADSSDGRIKNDVHDYTTGLSAVISLRPVWYKFKPETDRDSQKSYVGLVAQEAEQVMPEMVYTTDESVGRITYKDMRILDSSALIYALVNAIKELNAKVENLEAQIHTQR